MIKIRVSALPFYLDCPRRAAAGIFNFQLLQAGYRIPKYPPGVAAAVGHGAHASARYIIDEKGKSGNLPPLDYAQGNGIDEYRQHIEAGVMYDGVTPNNNDAEDQIQTLARSYYYEIAPRIDAQGVVTEHKLKARCGDAEITGTLDLDLPETVRDLKTGRYASFVAQVGGYSLLKRSNHSLPKGLFIDYLPRTRVDKPYPGASSIEYPLPLAENTAMNIIKKIIRDVKEFEETGDPWAFSANPKSMLCNPKYCSCYGSKFCELGGV